MGLEKIPDNLFTRQNTILANYELIDLIRGRAYITLFGLGANPELTTYESYTTGDDGNAPITNINWVAQTFTVGNTGTNEDFWVTGIEIKANSTITSSRIIVSIQALSGGDPDGVDLAYGDIEGIPIDSASQFTRISFDQFTKLSAGVKYAVVFRRIGATNTVNLRRDGSSPTYTGGSVFTSSNSGGSWTEDTAKDLLFKIHGNTVNPLSFLQEDLDSSTSRTFEDITDLAYTQLFTADMDVKIGGNSLIQGTAFIVTPINLDATGNNELVSFYWELELLRVRNGTETSMGTTSSETTTTSVNGLHTEVSQIDISNNVGFKPNDLLKLRLKFFTQVDDGVAGTDFTINWKDITIKIPFKLDVEIN